MPPRRRRRPRDINESLEGIYEVDPRETPRIGEAIEEVRNFIERTFSETLNDNDLIRVNTAGMEVYENVAELTLRDVQAPYTLVITNDKNDNIITIHCDTGKVELSDKANLDEASVLFWNAIEVHGMKMAARIKELEAKIKELEPVEHKPVDRFTDLDIE